MFLRDIARLLIKLTGLVILIFGITSLPRSLGWLFASDVPNRIFTMLTVGIAPATLWIVVGGAMYYGAGRIADRALLRGEPESAIAAFDFRGLEEIAVSVLGLYVFSSGIAEGIYYWAKLDLYYRYAVQMVVNPPPIPQTEYAGIAAAGTR